MKTKIFLLAVLVTLICSCTNKQNYQMIAPFPVGFSVDSLMDCMVPASFTSDDFRWMGGNLDFKVYNEDLYDAVEISLMKEGDTLVYDSDTLVVKSIDEINGLLEINGGLENGGCWLMGYEGGTYRGVIFDDHSVYTCLGSAHAALADDFIIIDCGMNPTDPVDTIRESQKLYLESLEGSRRNFTCLDTKVRLENGLIVEINRHWIP